MIPFIYLSVNMIVYDHHVENIHSNGASMVEMWRKFDGIFISFFPRIHNFDTRKYQWEYHQFTDYFAIDHSY